MSKSRYNSTCVMGAMSGGGADVRSGGRRYVADSHLELTVTAILLGARSLKRRCLASPLVKDAGGAAESLTTDGRRSIAAGRGSTHWQRSRGRHVCSAAHSLRRRSREPRVKRRRRRRHNAREPFNDTRLRQSLRRQPRRAASL